MSSKWARTFQAPASGSWITARGGTTFTPVQPTGRGTPLGNAASVTVKITGNPDTYARLGAEMIDFDASGVIVQNQDFRLLAKDLYRLVLEIAGGIPSKSERMEDFSWVTPPSGKI